MSRRYFVVVALAGALGCDASNADGDAKLDAGLDATKKDEGGGWCAADFPCNSRFLCLDATHYANARTVGCEEVCPTAQCSGATCRAEGDPMACEQGLQCGIQTRVGPDAGADATPCTFGGHPDCMPTPGLDAGANPPLGTHPPESACDPAALAQARERCFDEATRSDPLCTTFQNGHPACWSCLVGEKTGRGLFRETGEPNVPGCVGLLGSPACASATLDRYACSDSACQLCPEDDFVARVGCGAKARSTLCPASSACTGDGGAPSCDVTTIVALFDVMAAPLCNP